MIDVAGIKRLSAADEVFKALHEWILTGRLKPGDRLPSQDELAERFAVSRNTLREAVNKLAALGLLEVRQGVGTVVRVHSPLDYVSSLSDHLLLDNATGREFLEARVIMETAAVRLAARRLDPAELERLRELARSQTAAMAEGDIDLFSQLDAEFHLELAKLSRNRVLVKFLETAWDLLRRFILEVAMLPGAIQDAHSFHTAIIAALEERAADRAEEALMEHLVDVVRRIESNLGLDMGAETLFDLECPRRRTTRRRKPKEGDDR